MVKMSLNSATYMHRAIEYVPALVFIALTYYVYPSPFRELVLLLGIIWARYCMQILDKFGLLSAIFGSEMELV